MLFLILFGLFVVGTVTLLFLAVWVLSGIHTTLKQGLEYLISTDEAVRRIAPAEGYFTKMDPSVGGWVTEIRK